MAGTETGSALKHHKNCYAPQRQWLVVAEITNCQEKDSKTSGI